MGEFVLVIKVTLILVSIAMLHQGKLIGFTPFLIAGFLTGFEWTLAGANDNPWAYLVAGNASEDELFRALFSGALVGCFPFLMFLLCKKDLISLMDSIQASNEKQENTKSPRR